MNIQELEYLKTAAEMVTRQAEEAEYGIPVDPDVADFMGAFEENALHESDL